MMISTHWFEKYVGVVFINLKKAFDTVDHESLLQELAHYGIQVPRLHGLGRTLLIEVNSQGLIVLT